MTSLPLVVGGLILVLGLAVYLRAITSRGTSWAPIRRWAAGVAGYACLTVTGDVLRASGFGSSPELLITCTVLGVFAGLVYLSVMFEDWIESALDSGMVAGCLVLIGFETLLIIHPVNPGLAVRADVLALLACVWSSYVVGRVMATTTRGRALQVLFLGFPGLRLLAWLVLLADSGLDLRTTPWLAGGLMTASYASMGLFGVLLARGANPLPRVRAAQRRSTAVPYLLCALALVITLIGLALEQRFDRPVVYLIAGICTLSLIGRQLVTLRGLRRVTDRALARESHYRSLLTDSTDVIMICSSDGRLEYVSPAADHVLGPGLAVEGSQIWTALSVSREAFAAAVAQLEHDAGSVLVEGRRGHVVLEAALSRRGSGLLASVRNVTERDRLRQRLHFLAYHDPLTGLVNRSRVLARISAMLGRGEPCAVLFVDLDRFKQVNDNSGHGIGDQVLQQVARRLAGLIRDGDLIGRLGGDEFVAVLGAGQASAEAVAGRLCEVLAVPFEVDGRVYQLGASVGIALAAPGLLPDELLRRADLAMYEAKRRRSSWVVYESVLARAALAQANSDVAVSRALRDKTMDLHLQPLVDLASGTVVTVEALLRWIDDDGQVRSPAEMLDFARRSGRMAEVTAWVLERGVDVLSRSPQRVSVAVNMPPEILLAPALPSHLLGLLAQHAVAPSRLELEVTEDQLLEQAASSGTAVQTLRDLGMPVMIDDFGTGFSSLGYLVDLPIDGLKIDQRFTMALPHSEAARSIVGGLVGIARQLGLRVVAEGIETEAQHEWACRLGVHLGQGFWYARPESASALADIGDLGSWASSRLAAARR
ncbi:MAG: EAL domain-containing protein [Kineosporiaceae bacterium]